MDGPVIGRKAELAAAMAFLDTLPSGPAALLIEGEAGVGKTTIWNEAVRAAGGRGIRVLACRPVESEASLSFVGLSDLLGEHADTVLPELAPLQRRAIEVALLRTDPRGAPPDQRVIGAATTSVLSTLAEEGPVLVAVDDDQWLDRPTARSLA
ncbi:MAG: ATP-binding protein, partial [Actinobacteria bacterium]|nr:ATP-binding protein [Actinomycetota bacterium]